MEVLNTEFKRCLYKGRLLSIKRQDFKMTYSGPGRIFFSGRVQSPMGAFVQGEGIGGRMRGTLAEEN